MTAVASPAWLSAELAYINGQAHERLEEFAFYVAEDIEWLNEYTKNVVDQERTDIFELLKTPKQIKQGRTPFKDISNNDSDTQKSAQLYIATSKARTPIIDSSAHVLGIMPPDAASNDDPSVAEQAESQESSMDISDTEADAILTAITPESRNLVTAARLEQVIEAEEQTEMNIDDESGTRSSKRALTNGRQAAQLTRDVEDLESHVQLNIKLSTASSPSIRTDAKNELLESSNQVVLAAGSNGSQEEEHTQALPGNHDFLLPTNLNSPVKRTESRADSLYFSANESPAGEKSLSSERQSIAFASLPPRQPFSKKSLGHRSSQSRSSVYDSSRSQVLSSNVADQVLVKAEPAATPQLSRFIFQGASNSEITAFDKKLDPVVKLEYESEQVLEQLQTKPALHKRPTIEAPDSEELHASREQPQRPAIDPGQNPSDTVQSEYAIQSEYAPINPFVVATPRDLPIAETEVFDVTVRAEEDEWLPRFDRTLSNSPKKPFQSVTPVLTEPPQASQPTNLSRLPSYTSPQKANEKHTPGPLRAAMQAASAKATSYLRSARTAFGSPSAKHDRVFPSTTPLQSPPKKLIKAEPQTPALYPKLNITSADLPSSKIPNKSTKKASPSKHATSTISSWTSPRKPTQKIAQAQEDTIFVDGRNIDTQAQQNEVSASTKKDSEADNHDLVPSREIASSPKKFQKLMPKLIAMPKSKPLSIRVATASQRDLPKDRKAQFSTIGQSTDGSLISRATSEDSQVDWASKAQSSAANSKRVIHSKQIKALAAANQAKEKADKDQERREQHRKEVERRRQENVKRLASEEENRKAEQRKTAEIDEKKRKASADARSNSTKKHLKPIAPVVSRGTVREPSSPPDRTNEASNRPAQQSLKRPIAEAGIVEADTERKSILPDSKRRCTEEPTDVRSLPAPKQSLGAAIKPMRVSLHKKDPVKLTFGAPGEPGYKKPGTYPTKIGPSVEAVKFSNEPIRFAHPASTTIEHVSKNNINPLPPSELIELPEINSDYSDSEDDEPQRTDGFVMPSWAESPELRKRLRKQSRVDPDDVFGPIPPLQMEEIFKGKERALARFRPRSSSANWSGTDRLTTEEVMEYAKSMGYKP